MKRKIVVLLLFFAMLSFSFGCDAYSSSYITTMCVRSCFGKSAFISFGTFEGTTYFKFSPEAKGWAICSASLEEGEISVYYDNDGEKRDSFKINGGKSFDTLVGMYYPGTYYIIIEAKGKCKKGEFKFMLEDSTDSTDFPIEPQ